jgi:zinc protease
MKTQHISISLLLSLSVFAGCATGGIAYRKPPAEDWRNTKPVASPMIATKLPVFESTRLNNGLQVILVKESNLPIVTYELLVKAGSSSEKSRDAGLASMVSKMLTKGTKNLDADAYAEALADIGTDIEVGCDKDAMNLGLGVLTRHTEAGLALLSDAVLKPAFSSVEFKRLQRLQISTLKKRQGNPRAVGSDIFFQKVYGVQHPYGHATAGNVSSIENIDLRQIRKFYRSHYGPATATLIVAGDIETDKMLAQIKKYFGKWKTAATPPATPIDVKTPEKLQIFVVPRKNAPQSLMMIGRTLIRKGDPDEYRIKVMNAAFGGLFNSRLNMKLREEKQYTYGARSNVSPLRGQGVLVAGGMIKGENTIDALKETLTILEETHQKGISKEELGFSKDSLIKPLPSYFETIEAIAGAAATLATYDLPMNQYELVLKQIKAVTLEDTTRVAKERLAPQHYTVVLVGDDQHIKERLTEIKNANITYLNENGEAL